MHGFSKGSISKHKDHWRAFLHYYDSQGTRRQLSRVLSVKCKPDKRDASGKIIQTNSYGRREAERELAAWRAEVIKIAEINNAHELEDTTVCAYIERYCEDRITRHIIEDATYRGYLAVLRRLRGTPLGNAQMVEVTPDMIMDWERAEIENNYADSTISKSHVFLKQVFTYAYKAEDIHSNPFNLIPAPKRVRKPINSLTLDGVQKLEGALKTMKDEPVAIAAHIAVMTGMREGEICGLRWRSIDFDRELIRITHSIKRVRGHYIEGTPKTPSSIRNIPISPSLMNFLRARRIQQRDLCDRFGVEWTEDIYVCGDALTGDFLSPYKLMHDWRILARLINLVGTQGRICVFHDLRHTAATMMIGNGVDVKTTSVLLGHSNPAMTLQVYADSLESSKRDAVAKLDEVYGW